MTSLTDLREVVDVVIGVDAHVHTHSAAAVDARTGGVLDEVTVEATADGYAQLQAFAQEHAVLRAWAIEGTGGHGAGLARHLARDDELVLELDRPVRAHRRNGAKSDPLDAIRPTREALSRALLGTPRGGGDRQSLSVLLAARRSAVEAGTDAQRQVFGQVIAVPEQIRARFRGQKLPVMMRTAAALRVHPSWDTETTTTVTVLRSLARRARALLLESTEHEKAILRIVRSWRPDLLEQPGVAPIPATSGLVTTRHRLNRYGDRQLNRALNTIALSRIRYDQTTRDYLARGTAEGKSRREIRRCLKRYIARDLNRLLEHRQPIAS